MQGNSLEPAVDIDLSSSLEAAQIGTLAARRARQPGTRRGLRVETSLGHFLDV